MSMNDRPIRFAFFGTKPLAEHVLKELTAAGLVPERIIESAKITSQFIEGLSIGSSADRWDVFVVASFGTILPKKFLEIPRHGVINVHPSLLPHLRGPSPIRSAILQDERTSGVSIMLLDEKMDHGPLLAQKRVVAPLWPMHGVELDELLAREGGKLLADVLPLWVKGEIEVRIQNDDLATYCREFRKEDGLLDLHDDSYRNLLKIRAFQGWPGTYAIFERADKRIRVQILDAHLRENHSSAELIIDTVKPEGRREMSYEDFLRSGAKIAT